VTFDVFIAIKFHIMISWVKALCDLVGGFGVTYCLYPHYLDTHLPDNNNSIWNISAIAKPSVDGTIDILVTGGSTVAFISSASHNYQVPRRPSMKADLATGR
jgi:hypothetical protein